MVYIQSDKDRILPHHFDCACALYGAMDLAKDYRLASFEEVVSGKFDGTIRNNVFAGSVEFMREVFRRVGMSDVRLPMNSDRSCELITLGDAHKRAASGEKLFIKPVTIKLFTGLVLDGATYSCLSGLSDDTKVMAYEPFGGKILSEWRIYVHNHKIVDSRNYAGDFILGPVYSRIKDSVIIANEKEHKFPCAYTIDVAVIQSEICPYYTEIVEYNDMWAIGNYGVPNDIYLRMLSDRYFEIMGKKL